MEGNGKRLKTKRYVMVTLVVLTLILFALIANLLRLQQISTQTRAELPKTILVPTSAVSLVVNACGIAKVNCSLLKPNITNSSTSSIIPTGKLGEVVINMQCVETADEKDAVCAYKAVDSIREGCLRGAAFIAVGAGNTTPKCLGVTRNTQTNMCHIVELKKATGVAPSTLAECQQLLISPTKVPPTGAL